MDIKKLLKKGYFPKELPPPFTTSKLAAKITKIQAASPSYVTTAPLESKTLGYSILKGRGSRRKLEVPHPKHFIPLCEHIVSMWDVCKSVFSLSSYSESSPIEKGSIPRSVRTKSKSLNNFRVDLLNKAYSKQFELKFDITQFYPTIYTHSITWAIMGREDAKKYFKLKSNRRTNWNSLLRTDDKANLYDNSNKLDTLVRNCQEKQSIGIPIGPDTSFIISELIGSRLDYEIRNSIGSDIMGSRYYDDFYYYLNTRSQAEIILRQSQKIINDYKLEINERKVSITEAPYSFEFEWANVLSNFRFKNIDQYELRSFFDILFRLISRFPNDSNQIVHYGLQRFEYGNVPIYRSQWKGFLLLTLHLQSFDASNLDQFLKIVLSYRAYVDKASKNYIRTTIEFIIEKHVPLNHSFEVSWSLWIMISLKIKCRVGLLIQILDSQDSASKLICLDLIARKLYIGRKPKTSHIFKSFVQDDLYGESWLFIYEAIFKGWLARSNINFLRMDSFINCLVSNKVSFYKTDNQIELEFKYDPRLPNPIVRTKNGLTQSQQDELLFAAASSKY